MVNSIYGCEVNEYVDDGMKGDMCVGAHEAIERARHDERAVSVEMYCGDIVEMGVQCFGASTCA
jgi:hypothetical protein